MNAPKRHCAFSSPLTPHPSPPSPLPRSGGAGGKKADRASRKNSTTTASAASGSATPPAAASSSTALVVSPKTARNHVEHVYSKLGVSSRAAATLYATQHGLLGTFESA